MSTRRKSTSERSRQSRKPRQRMRQNMRECGAQQRTSESPAMGAREAAARLLALPDPAVVDVVLATLLANRIEGDPLWVVLVSPPSNGKTELLNAARHVPRTHPLSTLTKHTLISGQKPEDGSDREPSLLERLKGTTLILKDFTTILTLHRDDRSEILGVLREVYDGCVSKSFGTGKTYTWEGKLGLLAGCTPAIDRHWAVLSALGERFLFCRLPSEETERRREQARKALKTSGKEKSLRDALGQAMEKAYAKGLEWYEENKERITIPSHIEETLITLADLLARARAPVQRDGHTRDVVAPSEPEGPGRLVKQLRQLALGFCIIHHTLEPGEEALAILRKVAQDTMPPFRARILSALARCGGMTLADLEKVTGLPHATASRELEDCRLLKLVEHGDEAWCLSSETRKAVEDSEFFF